MVSLFGVISLGMVMFTTIILTLVAVILVTRAKLVTSGDVFIIINGERDKPLRTRAGGTLLGALAEQKIFIPSACGGKGSCGVCKVTVKEGGGAMLPTELSYISRGLAREGCRLSCQVKVKQNMEIEVPAEIFHVREWTCKVHSNHNVATFIKELILELPAGEAVPFRAGGYIQITCPPHTASYKNFVIEDEYREDWDKFNLWQYESVCAEPVTRAFSMANCPAERAIIMLNVRVATPPPRAPKGSSRMSSLMKVATLWFEWTLQVHSRTWKISAGTSISMFCLTLTWQERRQPSRARPRLMYESSVGSMAPPPSFTVTLHTPQLPLPPQAEGMKIFCSASAPSSVPPARVRSGLSLSPLMMMNTSPLVTSLALVTKMTATSVRMMVVNITMPRLITPNNETMSATLPRRP